MNDWSLLQRLLELCKYHSVSFTLEFCESESSWEVNIYSSALCERFRVKKMPFEYCVKAATSWLDNQEWKD